MNKNGGLGKEDKGGEGEDGRTEPRLLVDFLLIYWARCGGVFAKAAKGKGRQLDGQSVFIMAKLTKEASVSGKYVW